MTARESSPSFRASFRDDPVGYLDRAFPAGGDAFWIPGRQLCLTEPLAARAVLANDGGLYHEHSDFFFTRRGIFGPRSSQVKIGRPSRPFLRDHLAAHAGRLTTAVEALAPSSHWPDAGNWLIYRHLASALLGPATPASVRKTIDEVVERAVLAGARGRYSALRRAFFRRRVERELCREIERRRSIGIAEPADVLDLVVAGAEPAESGAAAPRDLAEVFLSFLFAIAGSVGFVLGWSLYLLGTNPPTAAPAAAIVQEALRLWPVAWLLGRRPLAEHTVVGETVTPKDMVVVCPYLVHRHPRFWPEPEAFRPERWAESPDQRAFLPFGWGPHACVAGSLSMELVAEVLTLLFDRFELSVTVVPGARPSAGPALAPPPFRVDLAPRRPAI